MSVGRLIVPLTMVLIAIGAVDACAQGAWPGQAAPIPGLIQGPMAPFPQAGGSQDQCMTDFQPLRDEAERHVKLIKAAGNRHATPEEACPLIRNFAQAEIKMIRFVEAHATQCGPLARIADQLRNGYRETENMQRKVCAVAQQRSPRPGPPGPLGDFPPWYL
jgi:hypothetical protein